MGADCVSDLGSRGGLRLYRCGGGSCRCRARVILHLPSHLPGSACARSNRSVCTIGLLDRVGQHQLAREPARRTPSLPAQLSRKGAFCCTALHLTRPLLALSRHPLGVSAAIRSCPSKARAFASAPAGWVHRDRSSISVTTGTLPISLPRSSSISFIPIVVAILRQLCGNDGRLEHCRLV